MQVRPDEVRPRAAGFALAQAQDAVVLDTDGLSIEEVIAAVLEMKQRLS